MYSSGTKQNKKKTMRNGNEMRRKSKWERARMNARDQDKTNK